METGSDFAIGLISSPRWEQDTEQKRRPSNDRVPGNKTERETVLSTCLQQEPQALSSKRLKSLPDQGSHALSVLIQDASKVAVISVIQAPNRNLMI
jgi:hypothetical protein